MTIMNHIKTSPRQRQRFEYLGRIYVIDVNRIIYFDELGPQGLPLRELMEEDKYSDNILFNIAVNRALYKLRTR